MLPYTYITRQHQLDLALTRLRDCPRIAVDTESSGYYTYFPELCLIQISADNNHFVIDVLAGLDLTGLASIFYDSSITKIFHAASSDILEMQRDFKWKFRNIFDTFLACKMLGKEGCSLAQLVKDYAGEDLQKKEQKSNWKKRPLTRSQLDYAHLDTAFLEMIMDHFTQELKGKGLYEEILEEFDFLCNSEMEENFEKNINPDAWMKISDACKLSPAQRGILKSLVMFREQKARQLNIAPFRLITNQQLYSIAKNRPESGRQLSEAVGFNSDFVNKEGERILKLIGEAEAILECDMRRTGNYVPEIEEQFKKLKKWRQAVADRRKLESSVVLSNRVMKTIAEKKPENLDQLRDLNLMTEWKIKHYGQTLLEILAGQDAQKILLP